MQSFSSSRRRFLQLMGAGAATISIIPLVKLSQETKSKYTSFSTSTDTQITTATQNIESLLLDSALKNLAIVNKI
jgi:purine nucleoside phosphorylase